MKPIRIRSKSWQTFFAVFSVLATFCAICALALLLLYHAGAFQIPSIDMGDEKQSSPQGGFSLPIRQHTDAPATTLDDPAEEAETLLSTFPLYPDYCMEASVWEKLPEAAGGGETRTVYTLWRYGEKFRIHQYDASFEAVQSFICDGNVVLKSDFRDLTTELLPLDEQHSFLTLSPLYYLKSKEKITLFSSSSGTLTVVRGNETILTPDGETVPQDWTRLTYDIATGLPLSCEIFSGGEKVVQITFSSLDVEFRFTDSMFELPIKA